MKYLCVIDYNEDGYTISCPDFPMGGFMANDDARGEAIAQAQEALAVYLREVGNPVPRFGKLADVPQDVLAALLAPPSKPEGILLEPAPMNPVSLEVARVLESSDQSLRSLAKMAGTSPAALVRMKDPFYWGHSLKTLSALGDAVQARVEVKFKSQPRAVVGGLRKSAKLARSGV